MSQHFSTKAQRDPTLGEVSPPSYKISDYRANNEKARPSVVGEDRIDELGTLKFPKSPQEEQLPFRLAAGAESLSVREVPSSAKGGISGLQMNIGISGAGSMGDSGYGRSRAAEIAADFRGRRAISAGLEFTTDLSQALARFQELIQVGVYPPFSNPSGSRAGERLFDRASQCVEMWKERMSQEPQLRNVPVRLVYIRESDSVLLQVPNSR